MPRSDSSHGAAGAPRGLPHRVPLDGRPLAEPRDPAIPRGSRNDKLLEVPEGGSLNELAFKGNVVIKRYSGTIPRGHQKLRREYFYLIELPPRVAASFARPVLFLDRDDPRLTELHLRRHPEPAVAKAILRGLLTPADTRRIVKASSRILLDDLYPLRHRILSGPKVYSEFHAPRLKSAVAGLRHLPTIRELVHATDLRVNGVECPSTVATLAWLDSHAASFFAKARLVAAHGDWHLDNMLAPTDGAPGITFVDPRGELTMPPHYDWAKMLKAARTGYDLIHYGLYELHVTTGDSAVQVDLAIDRTYDQHYDAALEVLVDTVPAYAAAERVTPRQFLTTSLIAELSHLISFSYYHANHPRGCDTSRVLAYLSAAALLAGDLMRRQPDPMAAVTAPLPI